MKKRRIITLTVVVVVLALAAVVLVMNKASRNTLDKDSDFAISDTSNVTRVFLADKQNRQVELKRDTAGHWLVNDTYYASPDAIKTLLKTLISLDVKSMVSKSAHNNVVKLLATTSAKVEIYQKVYFIDLFDKIKWFPYEKRTKTYYVGIATQNNLGTYMLMDGADAPYVVHIPGFNGFLSSRYSTIEKDWRDHTVFKLRYQDIASVSLQFSEAPDESYKMIKKSPREFSVLRTDARGNVTGEILLYDTLKVMDLFSSFLDIRFEALVDDIEQRIIDSIRGEKPFQILTVEEIGGKKHVVKTLRKKSPPDQYDLYDELILWDLDRMYALINDDRDLVLIQFFIFDGLLRPLSYFTQNQQDVLPE